MHDFGDGKEYFPLKAEEKGKRGRQKGRGKTEALFSSSFISPVREFLMSVLAPMITRVSAPLEYIGGPWKRMESSVHFDSQD